ncbi:MAG: DUF971 domain-containing protein [SAR324 cluster bacterium]|nr:DUF971 domain-containing protein [SAR324 cluster bacterium]
MKKPKDIYWDKELTIIWQDDSKTSLKFYTLRLACPCAVCIDELSGDRKIKPEEVSLDIHPIDGQYVGNYSIRFTWSDKHDTGIYTFQYLDSLANFKI